MGTFEDGGFAPAYKCEIDPEFPGSGEWTSRIVAYSRDGERVDDFRSRWGSSLIFRVEPEDAPAWVGFCEAGGLGGIDGVFACPTPTELCAVAQGRAYVLDVREPSSCWLPRVDPVVQVESAPHASVLVLADFTDLAAIGTGGIRWESGRLCLDGLKIRRISGNEVHCEGDYLEGTEQFVIDSQTGDLISGQQFVDPFG